MVVLHLSFIFRIDGFSGLHDLPLFVERLLVVTFIQSLQLEEGNFIFFVFI